MGNDFFLKNKAVIDFKKHTIKLQIQEEGIEETLKTMKINKCIVDEENYEEYFKQIEEYIRHKTKHIRMVRRKKKINNPSFYSYLPENFFDKYKKLETKPVKEKAQTIQENFHEERIRKIGVTTINEINQNTKDKVELLMEKIKQMNWIKAKQRK